MNLILQILSLAPAVTVHAYSYGLGKSWLIGSASSSSIRSVSTTFNPGSPPSPPNQVGHLALYPALSNGTGDLLIASVESWPNQSWCGGTSGQWCIRTSVFSNRRSTDGPFAPLNANEPVTLTFERSADDSVWTQSAIVNGEIVSQLTYPSGPMALFGITTECDDACTIPGPLSQQTYTNTTIVLDAPNASWNSTAVIGSQIYGSGSDSDSDGEQLPTVVQGLSSSDGGKVWTVDEIIIPPLN